jgi:hypothetical protein
MSVKFTQADKEYFAAVRKEKPHVDQLFKDIRSLMDQFPGSKITYLSVDGNEWGEPSPPGVPVLPKDRPETIPNAKQKQRTAVKSKRPTTKAEKYRQLMRYKE